MVSPNEKNRLRIIEIFKYNRATIESLAEAANDLMVQDDPSNLISWLFEIQTFLISYNFFEGMTAKQMDAFGRNFTVLHLFLKDLKIVDDNPDKKQ